jgi:hypothetical protein
MVIRLVPTAGLYTDEALGIKMSLPDHPVLCLGRVAAELEPARAEIQAREVH